MNSLSLFVVLYTLFLSLLSSKRSYEIDTSRTNTTDYQQQSTAIMQLSSFALLMTTIFAFVMTASTSTEPIITAPERVLKCLQTANDIFLKFAIDFTGLTAFNDNVKECFSNACSADADCVASSKMQTIPQRLAQTDDLSASILESPKQELEKTLQGLQKFMEDLDKTIQETEKLGKQAASTEPEIEAASEEFKDAKTEAENALKAIKRTLEELEKMSVGYLSHKSLVSSLTSRASDGN